ncbi:unnamed protein product [marine sediment metagenome]|uniref:Uncharacterized protein n=1 Tax=marine sediment metagenome TaxID=412755 RepID=X0RK10_9ZZZZ
MRIPPNDERLLWHGAVSVERTDNCAMPWRIPHEERGLFHEGVVMRAAMPAGVRIAFRSDTTTVAGTVEPQPDVSPIDLCCDGEVVGSAELSGRDEFRFDGLPAGEKAIELWLPQFGEFRLKSLVLSDGASLEPLEDERPRWLTYGSSITHCRAAESPTQTWPAIVARERGLNLTCLGYGGNCHLDPMVARMMRDLPADFISTCLGINIYGGASLGPRAFQQAISTCLGINIYGGASLGPRAFQQAIIGSVKTMRERHETIPIVLMSPIFAKDREETPNAVGFTLRAMREEVAAAAEALRAHGDANVHYVDGHQILGPEDNGLADDGVHPTAEGYKMMGRNFLDKVVARVFP